MYAQNRVMSEKGFITLAFILGIVLLSASVVGGSFYLKKNNPELLEKLTAFTKPNTTSQATNSANVTSESTKKIVQNQTQNNASATASLIVFTESPETASGNNTSKVQIYDLSKRKLIDLDPSLTTGNNGSPILGPLSPDGKYLPIYYVTPSPQKKPVFLYNLQDNKAAKLFETDDFLGISFSYLPFWLDNQNLAYDYNMGKKLVSVVNLKGEQQQISVSSTDPGTIQLKNNYITAPLDINNNKLYNTPESAQNQGIPEQPVVINGIPLPGKLKGQVIGLSNNYVVTLESPTKPTLNDLAQAVNATGSALNKDLQGQNQQQATETITKALQPKGDWLFNFYKLPEGTLEKSITAQDSGWIIRDALIRPNKNTILVHQQDKVLLPTRSRYTEIDPQQPSQRRIISQEAGTGAQEELLGNTNSFAVTPEGTWLIGMQPSGSKGVLNKDLIQIVAWNIDTKEKVIICQKEGVNCSSFRIYNPSQLRLVTPQETAVKSSQH